MIDFFTALLNLGVGLWMARMADRYQEINRMVKASYFDALVSLNAGEEKTRLLRRGKQLMRRNRIKQIIHIILAAINFLAVGIGLGAFFRW